MANKVTFVGFGGGRSPQSPSLGSTPGSMALYSRLLPTGFRK